MDPDDVTSPSEHSQAVATLAAKAVGSFLSAAVGDALGWPQERSSSKGSPSSASAHDGSGVFQEWTRRAGGQFLTHSERVRPGEYSDDTQLIVCTARSLLCGGMWWTDFTNRELAMWVLVERGGGSATRRAAAAWARGKRPWEQGKPSEVQSYFHAGGNGVTMRILPHCVRAAGDGDFSRLAHDIVANGVCTHGHPRALVGALAYGYALWLAFKQIDTLVYGALIDRTIAAASEWSGLPDIEDAWPGWLVRAREVTGSYEDIWKLTTDEMLRLLETAKRGIARAALSVDHDVLQEMRCFERSVSGAGTIAAAAALFLASRYAVDPIVGVLEAAYANGADTDTLASMTAALLGALNGTDWLARYAVGVQDAAYLRRLAIDLATSSAARQQGGSGKVVTTAQLEAAKRELASLGIGEAATLPDGSKATLVERTVEPTRTRNTDVVLLRLNSDQGQTIFVKTFARNKETQRSTQARPSGGEIPIEELEVTHTPVVRVGVRFAVRDMSRARDFYERTLGLTVLREHEGVVTFSGGISIYASEGPTRPTEPLHIYIETINIDRVYSTLARRGAAFERELTERKAQRSFRCVDPDGNPIEVFEWRTKPAVTDETDSAQVGIPADAGRRSAATPTASPKQPRTPRGRTGKLRKSQGIPEAGTSASPPLPEESRDVS